MSLNFDIEYPMQSLYIAKIFYDHDKLNDLLDCLDDDITISWDELSQLEQTAVGWHGKAETIRRAPAKNQPYRVNGASSSGCAAGGCACRTTPGGCPRGGSSLALRSWPAALSGFAGRMASCARRGKRFPRCGAGRSAPSR